MPYATDTNPRGITVILHRVGIRALLAGLAVAALMAVVFTLGGVGAA